jgi:hypothetical protein
METIAEPLVLSIDAESLGPTHISLALALQCCNEPRPWILGVLHGGRAVKKRREKFSI